MLVFKYIINCIIHIHSFFKQKSINKAERYIIIFFKSIQQNNSSIIYKSKFTNFIYQYTYCHSYFINYNCFYDPNRIIAIFKIISIYDYTILYYTL